MHSPLHRRVPVWGKCGQIAEIVWFFLVRFINVIAISQMEFDAGN